MIIWRTIQVLCLILTQGFPWMKSAIPDIFSLIKYSIIERNLFSSFYNQEDFNMFMFKVKKDEGKNLSKSIKIAWFVTLVYLITAIELIFLFLSKS